MNNCWKFCILNGFSHIFHLVHMSPQVLSVLLQSVTFQTELQIRSRNQLYRTLNDSWRQWTGALADPSDLNAPVHWQNKSLLNPSCVILKPKRKVVSRQCASWRDYNQHYQNGPLRYTWLGTIKTVRLFADSSETQYDKSSAHANNYENTQNVLGCDFNYGARAMFRLRKVLLPKWLISCFLTVKFTDTKVCGVFTPELLKNAFDL